MKVSTSKKGLYSLTGLSLEELAAIHNKADNFLFKNSIRIALLDGLDGAERIKLQSQEDVEAFWQSLGLDLGKQAKTPLELSQSSVRSLSDVWSDSSDVIFKDVMSEEELEKSGFYDSDVFNKSEDEAETSESYDEDEDLDDEDIPM